MYCISLEALLKDGEHDKQKASALHSSIAQETIHIDCISIILRNGYRSNPQFKEQGPRASWSIAQISVLSSRNSVGISPHISKIGFTKH